MTTLRTTSSTESADSRRYAAGLGFSVLSAFGLAIGLSAGLDLAVALALGASLLGAVVLVRGSAVDASAPRLYWVALAAASVAVAIVGERIVTQGALALVDLPVGISVAVLACCTGLGSAAARPAPVPTGYLPALTAAGA